MTFLQRVDISVPPSVGVVAVLTPLSLFRRHLDLIKRSLPSAPNHTACPRSSFNVGAGGGRCLTAVTTPEL